MRKKNHFSSPPTNVIVFGAGESARQLLNVLIQNKNYQVVAVIDDDPSLQYQLLFGIKIYSRNDLAAIIEKNEVTEIFFSIAKISFSQRKNLLDFLKQFNCQIRVIPPFSEILQGKVQFSSIRNIDISDVLGRDEIPPDEKLLQKCITSKTVLITGAGGSIGSELCKQVLSQKPKRLILFEQSELALYQIEKKLNQLAKEIGVELIVILGSVLDHSRLVEVLQKFKPNTIYHAAAYKHVPLVELNIKEGFHSNTFATVKIAQLAEEFNVDNFLLISTDKAVRPTNFMGATKRLAEMAIQAIQQKTNHTIFTIVRFGNVLDSSGSVVPLFKEQIKSGGPITVTHPEITRYFMTISEAVSLVIQSSGMSEGGEVFVLEMGNPIKIVDLAKKMITLSGFDVAENQLDSGIEIQYTGLRPGEKLFEELIIGNNVSGTNHPRILKAMENYLPQEKLNQSFEKIQSYLKENQFNLLVEELNNLNIGFEHKSKIVDFFND